MAMQMESTLRPNKSRENSHSQNADAQPEIDSGVVIKESRQDMSHSRTSSAASSSQRFGGKYMALRLHNLSDGSLYRAHLLPEVEVAFFVWSSIVRRPGRSSAALRYPAPLTVRPLLL